MTTPTPYVLTLPLTDEQARYARESYGMTPDELEDVIRRIATPADATLPVAGYDGENSSSRYFFAHKEDAEVWAEQESGSIHECTRLTDAQAAIAAAGAEKDAKLRKDAERYAKVRWRFEQDAHIEGKEFDKAKFDSDVDADSEASAALAAPDTGAAL